MENAVITEIITLGGVAHQQATEEQDFTTFESTETLEEPYIPEQGPRVLRSNIGGREGESEEGERREGGRERGREEGGREMKSKLSQGESSGGGGGVTLS